MRAISKSRSKLIACHVFSMLLMQLVVLDPCVAQVSKPFPVWPTMQTLPMPARTLNFPPNTSAGGIAVLSKACFNVDDISDSLTDKSVNKKAQGTIHIPANKFVIFFPNHNFFTNPHILDGLPANSFDYVVFRYMSMATSEDNLGNPALAYLARFTGIRAIDLEKAEINDQSLKQLKTLVNLECIALFSTEIDGTFLKGLTGLKKLRFVGVNNTGFKKSELRYFCNLPALENLNISHNRLSDKDIEVLAGCKNLEVLGVGNNPEITDEALKTFALMPKLRYIDLRSTEVSNKALLTLNKKGIKLRGWSTVRPPASTTAARKRRGNGGVEEIFSPFSRGREL